MSEDNSSLLAHITENPRLIGILFAILLALSQAGSAAAAAGGTTY
ncbi:DUF7503 family protein [Halosolutus gelatinilyticus]|nr:hypothetical protein [Halosolutus gelatinilyticus]